MSLMPEFSGKTHMESMLDEWSVEINPSTTMIKWLKDIGPLTGKLLQVSNLPSGYRPCWSDHHTRCGAQFKPGEIVLALSEGYCWQERVYWDMIYGEKTVAVWNSYADSFILYPMGNSKPRNLK